MKQWIGDSGVGRGFSLVELMVAAAIGVLLLLLLAQLSSASIDLWSRAREQVVMEREARQAFDLLEEDLSALAARVDGRAWLRVRDEGEEGRVGQSLEMIVPWREGGALAQLRGVRWRVEAGRLLREVAGAGDTFREGLEGEDLWGREGVIRGEVAVVAEGVWSLGVAIGGEESGWHGLEGEVALSAGESGAAALGVELTLVGSRGQRIMAGGLEMGQDSLRRMARRYFLKVGGAPSQAW